MPIPNDDLNREWVDASNNNPDFVKSYRPCLIALIAFDRNHYPHIVGSGFIIGTNSEFSVALTAKHVLTFAAGQQRPVRHAPSALFKPENSEHPSIKESEFRANWMGTDSSDMLIIKHLGFNNELDIACGLLEPQKTLRRVLSLKVYY